MERFSSNQRQANEANMNYNVWTQFGKDLKTDDLLYLQECGKMGTYTLFMGNNLYNLRRTAWY